MKRTLNLVAVMIFIIMVACSCSNNTTAGTTRAGDASQTSTPVTDASQTNDPDNPATDIMPTYATTTSDSATDEDDSAYFCISKDKYSRTFKYAIEPQVDTDGLELEGGSRDEDMERRNFRKIYEFVVRNPDLPSFTITVNGVSVAYYDSTSKILEMKTDGGELWYLFNYMVARVGDNNNTLNLPEMSLKNASEWGQAILESFMTERYDSLAWIRADPWNWVSYTQNWENKVTVKLDKFCMPYELRVEGALQGKFEICEVDGKLKLGSLFYSDTDHATEEADFGTTVSTTSVNTDDATYFYEYNSEDSWYSITKYSVEPKINTDGLEDVELIRLTEPDVIQKLCEFIERSPDLPTFRIIRTDFYGDKAYPKCIAYYDSETKVLEVLADYEVPYMILTRVGTSNGIPPLKKVDSNNATEWAQAALDSFMTERYDNLAWVCDAPVQWCAYANDSGSLVWVDCEYVDCDFCNIPEKLSILDANVGAEFDIVENEEGGFVIGECTYFRQEQE